MHTYQRLSGLTGMCGILALLLTVSLHSTSLPEAVAQIDHEEYLVRVRQVPLYKFTTIGEKLSFGQEFMLFEWSIDSSNHGSLNPSKLRKGQIFSSKLVMLPNRPGCVGRRCSSMGRLLLGDIQPQSFYWSSVEYAYRHAVERAERTESIQKVGTIEINRMILNDGVSNVWDVDEGWAASMAVHFMALFRQELISESNILIGSLLPDGKIGPVNRLPEKVTLLGQTKKILIAPGQLAILDPIVLNQLQQRGTTVLEVNDIEEAYQQMVRVR